MIIDVNETAWYILETLHKHGSLNANQIQLRTKKITRETMYKAFPLLIKDELIQRDKKKIFSLNIAQFEEQKKIVKIYDDYKNLIDGMDRLTSKLDVNFKIHKRILGLSDHDKDIAREVLRSKSYSDIINVIINIFQLGSVLEFYINCGIFSKTIENKAISVRRKNENTLSKFFNLVRNYEPVLWGELVMLVQSRLMTKISPA